MFPKVSLISTVMLLAACSSSIPGQSSNARPLIHYAQNSSKIITVNSIASTGNQCVDNFNFLKQAGDQNYQEFSRQYITVGEGYDFLNKNKNIMDNDARQVYTMKLDMKLDTLCSKVNYTGYRVVQQKLKELKGI